VALWREALLAQAVLQGKTKGYRHHPQLQRFQGHRSPTCAIALYLRAVHREASARGYSFDAGKIGRVRDSARLAVTRGQVEHERRHLLRKLKLRDPKRRRAMAALKPARVHPLFRVVRGSVAVWEKT